MMGVTLIFHVIATMTKWPTAGLSPKPQNKRRFSTEHLRVQSLEMRIAGLS